MSRKPSIMRPLGRLCCIIWVCALAGCIYNPRQAAPPEPIAPIPEAVEANDEAVPPTAAPSVIAPNRPESPRPANIAPAPQPTRIVILLSHDLSGFEPTLADLESRLTIAGYQLTRVDGGDEDAVAKLAADSAAQSPRSTYVIAVGSDAARVAIDDLHLPVVFCQAPDREPAAGGDVHGVATQPPLTMQLRAWKQLDPGLARIGLILGRGQEALADGARTAAAALGLSLEIEIASSDQEALYLFKRLAPRIEGLWLLPDNTILSPRIIQAMLDHANRHRVQTLVFTPALLDWGALVSVTGTSGNLASTLVDVIDRLSNGDEVPAMTPLSELEVRVNPVTAAKLGLHAPATVWILPGGDS